VALFSLFVYLFPKKNIKKVLNRDTPTVYMPSFPSGAFPVVNLAFAIQT
jgi:hypothetical protein